MIDYRLGEIEQRFADMIWAHEPIRSGELKQLCEETFGWKKSTTYTVLKRLCDKGIFQNEDSVVSACITRDEFLAGKSTETVRKSYNGSLSQFIAAFTSREKLSDQEIEEIQAIIEAHRAEEPARGV